MTSARLCPRLSTLCELNAHSHLMNPSQSWHSIRPRGGCIQDLGAGKRPRLPAGAILVLCAGILFAAWPLHARSPIFLAQDPALSPDGQTLAFSWRGDIWSVAATGGVARLLTQHPGQDTTPRFSPDGRQLAFRLPFRGWFLPDTGEDMELNGAVLDLIVWPQPGQMPAGKDVHWWKTLMPRTRC